ncbi:MAG: FG-GAP repeat protein [Sphingomonadaceae bacterium]|nr:FG-GAP repeat protein [Sphingomonadaceae bacterium]
MRNSWDGYEGQTGGKAVRWAITRIKRSEALHEWTDWLGGGVEALVQAPLPWLNAPATIDLGDLDGLNGFRLRGIDLRDLSGRSVSAAGDVNGDGFHDIIIGAPEADGGSDTRGGETYVVFGKAGGFPKSFDLTNLKGNNGFRLDGFATYERSGWSVSTAGDINGDGFDDIMVGSIGHSPRNGETYIILGKSEFYPSLDLEALDGTNGFRISGIEYGDQAGWSVSSAGDVNGDGFDDMVIGAPAADGSASTQAGESYVVFGMADGFDAQMYLGALNGANGFRINGIDISDLSGSSVADAGDVNGDGFGDIIIGAPSANPGGRNNAGESYVVFGKASGFAASLELAQLDGSNGFRLDGISANDQSGFSVSAAGDVNGDGFGDILVGSPEADAGGFSLAGEAYVVFGKSSAFDASLILSALDGINGFRVIGPARNDVRGCSVSSVGDFNGDGIDDLLIGARGGEASSFGSAYILFGKVGAFAATFDLSTVDGTNGIRLVGRKKADFTGFSVSAAGDINRDGFADIIVGAPEAEKFGMRDVGASYVIFGFGDPGGGVIIGTSNGENLAGTQGDDTLRGLGGDDTLRGGEGADSLEGGSGRDWADYSAASGKAVAYLQTRTRNIGEARGDSYLSIENLIGSAFNDRLSGDGFANMIDGAGGNDRLAGLDGDDTLIGRDGNDVLEGGDAADSLDGGEGFDSLLGGLGLDVLEGEEGDDTLEGEEGNDSVSGDQGSDELFGGLGQDTLFGGANGDTLNGGASGDALDGGEGTDWADYGDALQKVGADLALAANNKGDAAGDSFIDIENLRGSAFSDRLRADSGHNVLNGGDGSDLLEGRGGLDTLIGGRGEDTLIGGAGFDVFLIDNIGEGGADVIVDFANQGDRIGLSAAVFGLAPGTLPVDSFRMGDEAEDFDDRIIYDSTDGSLYFDPDGNGFAAQTLIATIANLAPLSAQDFVVG